MRPKFDADSGLPRQRVFVAAHRRDELKLKKYKFNSKRLKSFHRTANMHIEGDMEGWQVWIKRIVLTDGLRYILKFEMGFRSNTPDETAESFKEESVPVIVKALLGCQQWARKDVRLWTAEMRSVEHAPPTPAQLRSSAKEQEQMRKQLGIRGHEETQKSKKKVSKHRQ